jgi:hypothetical protein
MLRHLLCWIMMALLPFSMVAADMGAAMVYTSGPAWLNGSTIPQSSAIFPGDIVQTQPGSEAKINSSGSSVRIFANSLVQFEAGDILIDQGGVHVGTSKAMTTRAGGITVAPNSNAWTQFEVTHADGRVRIVAEKGALNVTNGSTISTLAEGQETTTSDQTTADQTSDGKKKKKKKKGGAVVPGSGGIFNKTSALILAGALAGTGGLIAWGAGRGAGPISPAAP